MRLTVKVVAGALLAGSIVAAQAQAQAPDIRLLGYNSTLTAMCNVGCTQLSISLMLDGARTTDNTGAAVPGAVASLNEYLRNATFQIFGTNPTITSVSGAPGSFTTAIDNSPANFGALVFTDASLPLTTNSLSFTVNLAAAANPVFVSANGLAYVDAHLNYVNASGAIVPVPPALSPAGGPYYQTGDFNVAANISAVPEPSSYVLIATGLAGLLGVARRRQNV
jgi:hypothetical protein